MKHTGYTKGEWIADNHHIGDGWRVFVRHNADIDQHDAICDLETWQTEEETEANARLIADAPQLAEENERLRTVNAELIHACELALKALSVEYGDGKGTVDATKALHAFGNLKAALARGEGRE